MDKIVVFKNEWDELKVAVEGGDGPWALYLMNHIERFYSQDEEEIDDFT